MSNKNTLLFVFIAIFGFTPAELMAGWKVYAKNNGENISDAEIYENDKLVGKTNEYGYFEFDARPNDKIQLIKEINNTKYISFPVHVNGSDQDVNDTYVYLDEAVSVSIDVTIPESNFINPKFTLRNIDLGMNQKDYEFGPKYFRQISSSQLSLNAELPIGKYIAKVGEVILERSSKYYVKGFSLESKNIKQVEINESDAIQLGINTDLPPNPELISITNLTDTGHVLIVGKPGAVEGVKIITVFNMNTGRYSTLGSSEDGSFGIKFQAFPKDQIAIYKTMNDSNEMFPQHGMGTVKQVPQREDDESDLHVSLKGSILASDTTGRVYGGSVGSIIHASAATNGLDKTQGETLELVGRLEVVKENGFNDAPELASNRFNVYINPIIDESGYLTDMSPENSSTHMTVTGFPIENSDGRADILLGSFIVNELEKESDRVYTGEFNLTTEIPTFIPDGYYKINILPDVCCGNDFIKNDESKISYDWNYVYMENAVGLEGYSGILRVGNIVTKRLYPALLVGEFNNGERGINANEDEGRFSIDGKIKFHSHKNILLREDPNTGNRKKYNLEPAIPLLGTGNNGISHPIPLPLKYPSGKYSVSIIDPDGNLINLGDNQFKSPALHAAEHWNGGKTAQAQSPGEYFGLTTLTNDYIYEFPVDGEYTIKTEGYIEDVFGNRYDVGGTYDINVGNILELETGVFPGTPFEIGDSFNPALNIKPGVPANVEINLEFYPGSKQINKQIWNCNGMANRFGYFAPSCKPFKFTEPGEYRINYFVFYKDQENGYSYATRSWGGVVESQDIGISTHGTAPGFRDGVRRQWYFSEITPASNKVHTPVQNGDVSWMQHEYATPSNLGFKPETTIRDESGILSDLLGSNSDKLSRYDENIWLRSLSFITNNIISNSWLFQKNQDSIFAYSYIANGKPGVAIKEFIGEGGMENSYWRFTDPYYYQIGQGIKGDEPKDFKFIFNSAVFRIPSKNFSYYGATGSVWVMLPDDDPIGARVMPPFQGAAGGPSGGPLMILNDQDIDIFIHPMAIKPGSVLELGDKIIFSGQVAPTLSSKVEIKFKKPSGEIKVVSGAANKWGYYFDDKQSFFADEIGEYSVDVKVWHDGLTSAGKVEPPYPEGSVLGVKNKTFIFYVTNNDDTEKMLTANVGNHLKLQKEPLLIDLSDNIKPDNVGTYNVTISTPGFLIDEYEDSSIPINIDINKYLEEYTFLDFGNFGELADTLQITVSLDTKDDSGNVTKKYEMFNVLGGVLSQNNKNLVSIPEVPDKPNASDGDFSNYVQVTWKKVDNAVNYELIRCTNRSISSCSSKATNIIGTSYNSTSGSVWARYFYRVRACNRTGCSDWSQYDIGSKSSLSIPIIQLDALGRTIRTDGKKSQAEIAVGASSDYGETTKTKFSNDEVIDIIAKIYPQHDDVGEEGELFAVVRVYENNRKVFYSLNPDGVWIPWSASLRELEPAVVVDYLEEEEILYLHSGTMTGGNRLFYIGYSVIDDESGKPIIHVNSKPYQIDISD